jgi:hypothetical protein
LCAPIQWHRQWLIPRLITNACILTYARYYHTALYGFRNGDRMLLNQQVLRYRAVPGSNTPITVLGLGSCQMSHCLTAVPMALCCGTGRLRTGVARVGCGLWARVVAARRSLQCAIRPQYASRFSHEIYRTFPIIYAHPTGARAATADVFRFRFRSRFRLTETVSTGRSGLRRYACVAPCTYSSKSYHYITITLYPRSRVKQTVGSTRAVRNRRGRGCSSVFLPRSARS